MKVSVPAYLVALFVAFLYAVIHYYVPTLPLTEEQVAWIVLVILTALGIDVAQTVVKIHTALKAQGLLK